MEYHIAPNEHFIVFIRPSRVAFIQAGLLLKESFIALK
jgi:hypothetical protein